MELDCATQTNHCCHVLSNRKKWTWFRHSWTTYSETSGVSTNQTRCTHVTLATSSLAALTTFCEFCLCFLPLLFLSSISISHSLLYVINIHYRLFICNVINSPVYLINFRIITIAKDLEIFLFNFTVSFEDDYNYFCFTQKRKKKEKIFKFAIQYKAKC